jgi:hypothetical protein
MASTEILLLVEQQFARSLFEKVDVLILLQSERQIHQTINDESHDQIGRVEIQALVLQSKISSNSSSILENDITVEKKRKKKKKKSKKVSMQTREGGISVVIYVDGTLKKVELAGSKAKVPFDKALIT